MQWPSLDYGSLVDHVSSADDKAGRIEWLENYTFSAELAVASFARGRSAANFELKDSDGTLYHCFKHSLFDIVRDSRFAAGKIAAEWTFEKRGQNYGIIMNQEQKSCRPMTSRAAFAKEPYV